MGEEGFNSKKEGERERERERGTDRVKQLLPEIDIFSYDIIIFLSFTLI